MTKQKEIREGIEVLIHKGIRASRLGEYRSLANTVDDVLSYLHDNDVVIKVERELPYSVEDSYVCSEAMETIKKAGYTATEPLI